MDARTNNPIRSIEDAWGIAFGLVCDALGLDPAVARAVPPWPARVRDPNWLQVADARQLTIHLLLRITGCQRIEIARVVGVTPATITGACHRVGAARVHPGFGAWLDELETAVRAALQMPRPEADFLESLARTARPTLEDAA